MKIVKYKVSNFRSVKDSGWINCDDVTTLVGINEAGKSNLLLALWKLNPAFGGDIDIQHDMPVEDLAEMRDKIEEIEFISAQFELSEETKKQIGEKVECDCKDLNIVTISRRYNGNRFFDLHNVKPLSTKTVEVKHTDEEGNISYTTEKCQYDENDLLLEIENHMPKFVYYSNYGNLSSRVYLPNVIKWLNGENVPGIDINEDQVRTLRVLFKFVNLKPQEILELGKDIVNENNRSGNYRQPTEEEIQKIDNNKEKRSILLQSASTKLTNSFKEWWKQGEYKFRFEADGDYFRIWVSDSKRPAEVGLELRSTGLQWFLSFYLVFLVESQENHKNAILLLDEAGLTLHPLAQRDLAKFFTELSHTNQIINTTHSPFIVDTNNIDRCKVVYLDKAGYTVASDDLRQGADKINEKSIYAVHAALGLSVSDIILQGCLAVIVEGQSDQIYLTAIKQYLISQKKISPKEEIIFIPAGGVKGVSGIVSILTGKEGILPWVLVDSDKSGQDMANKLKQGLYKSEPGKIIEVGEDYSVNNAEIEDIIPYSALEKGVVRLFSQLEDEDFEPNVKAPIINQIEQFAQMNNVLLPKGWKVELAKKAKKKIIDNGLGEKEEFWIKVFSKFK